jgi:flavoprotein
MAIQMPACVRISAAYGLLRAEVTHQQIVQRCGGFGVEVKVRCPLVKLSSYLIEIRKEVRSVVHRHAAWLHRVEQCEVLSRPAEGLHVHVTKALVHVHLWREQCHIGLS